jgi:hypothetical protein
MTDEPVVLLDPSALTLGELEEIEEYAGYEALGRMLQGAFSPKVLVILTFLTMRRTNPAVTLAEVRGWNVERVDFAAAKKPKKATRAKAAAPDPNLQSSAG